MLYTKIRMDYIYGPKDRFYRTILVKGNPSLFQLGVMLGTVVGAEFEHCFLITCKDEDISYVMAPFMEDPLDGYKYINNYHLNDLPDNFTYEYDTGESWDFDCIRYEEKIELNSTRAVIILEGKGQGIWEDNVSSLHMLFDGKVDPNETEENDEIGLYKPWNCQIDKFGDFDAPLKINKINQEINGLFHHNLSELIMSEKEYIRDNHVNLSDYVLPKIKSCYCEICDSIKTNIQRQIHSHPDINLVYSYLSEQFGSAKAINLITDTYLIYSIQKHLEKKEFDKKEYLNRLFDLYELKK
jgi:hypothetical protein